ncbi:porin [Glaciimonas soli]|nr:porin [Glaciimonas soli]
MNKIIKISILLAFASVTGVAAAQSSVTIYGRADAALGREVDSNIFREGQGEGSLFGIKGTEDLGNSLKTFFDFQASITLNNGVQTGGVGVNGPAGLFDSKSIVGIGNQYGYIDAGRKLTPAWVVSIMADPFGTYSYVTRNNAGLHANHLFTSARMQNAVSLNWTQSGYFASLQAGDDTRTAVWAQLPVLIAPTVSPILLTGQRPLSMATGYNQGPTYLAIGYEKSPYNTSFVGVTGVYDFGVAKVSLGVESGWHRRVQDDVKDVKATNGILGLTIPMGPGLILASYDVLNTKILNANGGYDSYKTYPWISRKWGAGYQYYLSKYSFLYTDVVYDKEAPLGRFGYDLGISHHF